MTQHFIKPIVLALVATIAIATTSFAQAPKAPQGLRETFKGCTWSEIKGASLSIGSMQCGPKAGGQRLVADNTLPGFVLESKDDSGTSRKVAIRAFTIPAKAPITAALPAIRAASPGANTANCVLVPFDGADSKTSARGAAVFTFEPTGAAKTAWDKAEKEGGDADAPCGDLGIYFDRAPIFWIMRDDPTTVIAADMGSEIQIFDPTTLRHVAAVGR